MNINELYNCVENPLNDNQNIDKLIRAFAKTTTREQYYSNIMYLDKKEEENFVINEEDYEVFHVNMFNRWKQNTIDLPLNTYQGNTQTALLILKKYLKACPDATSLEDIKAFIKKHEDNPQLMNAIDMFHWENLSSNSTWSFVISSYFKPVEKVYNIEHRLYINTTPSQTYKMLNILMKYFDAYNLDFYYKFTNKPNRDDSIVIYCSSEDLPKYLEILEKIKDTNKDLIKNLKDAPVLTGKINGWIGYGCEPQDHQLSYSEIRAPLVYDALTKATHKWLITNKNKKVKYRRKEMPFKDYFKIQIIKNYMKELSEIYDKKVNIYGEEGAIAQLGYTKDEINDIEYIKEVAKKVNIDLFLNCLEEKGTYYGSLFTFKLPNGKNITINKLSLIELIHKTGLVISAHDKKYFDLIRKEVEKECDEYNIDPLTFCFDNNILNKFINNKKSL